jgi:CelD/BcsL family acetyltransferase involved in cellulose biosynthesis
MFDSLSLEEWQGFVESDPRRTAFHHRGWLELLVEQYGCVPRIIGLRNDHRVVGAVPFLEARKLLGKPKLISLPFTDYLQPLLQDRGALPRLAQHLRTNGRSRYGEIVLRTDAPLEGFFARSDRVCHVLGTSQSLGALTGGFSPSLRRNIRKAERHGLAFETGTDAKAVEQFYALHLLTRRKHGIPIQPRSFFRLLQERILEQGLGSVGLVSQERQPIAAAIFLTYNKTMIYKYGASNPSKLANRPNEWLFYHAIRQAVEEGCEWFDFGVSEKRHAGLRRFKSNWGAEEKEVYYNYAFAPPAAAGDSWTRSALTKAIQISPSIFCRSLGELFYKFSQ